ncbi:hypothetical protein N6H14_27530 [Paenibacillus sp. CC-CFT747]|nr:hypothetical protein N6H14_27530 [Paenibacillus sp. CC-CFT747]
MTILNLSLITFPISVSSLRLILPSPPGTKYLMTYSDFAAEGELEGELVPAALGEGATSPVFEQAAKKTTGRHNDQTNALRLLCNHPIATSPFTCFRPAEIETNLPETGFKRQ